MISLRASHAAEFSSLAKFRNFVDSNCAQAAIDSAICHDIKLAVDEACTNIIEHGYAGMDPGSIIIDFYSDQRRVIVTITDFGYAFEPYEPDTPDVEAILDGDHLGGFGLYFIYQTMDDVQYQTSADGNSLILTKYLA